jgi:hypothetical protein
LISIWPIKPPDVLTVLAFAVASSIVGSGFDNAGGRWAWWWAGVAAGLFVVLVIVVRRVRISDRT